MRNGHSGKSRTWVALKRKQSSTVTAWVKGLAVAAKLGEALVMQTDTVMLETDRGGLYRDGTSLQGGVAPPDLASTEYLSVQPPAASIYAVPRTPLQQPQRRQCTYQFFRLPLFGAMSVVASSLRAHCVVTNPIHDSVSETPRKVTW